MISYNKHYVKESFWFDALELPIMALGMRLMPTDAPFSEIKNRYRIDNSLVDKNAENYSFQIEHEKGKAAAEEELEFQVKWKK